MQKFLNSDWLRAVRFFRNTVAKNEIHAVQKKKYSANLIDYLGILIGLKYEAITNILNKFTMTYCICILLISTNSMVYRAI